MPITPGRGAPADARAVIGRYLSECAAEPASTAGLVVAAASSSRGGLSEGYRSYAVGLDDVRNGRLLEAAEPGPWVYLVYDGDSASGEVDLEARADGSQVVALRRGPPQGGTVDGLRRANAAPELAQGDFELRLLRAPALHLVALWFHGETDRIQPIAPDQTGLVHGQMHGPGEVLEVLQGLARSLPDRLHDDRLGG